MANVDNTKLIQFFTGTALPESPVSNYVYFIHNEGKGQLYKGSVLIGETNDTDAIAGINAAIAKINEDLAKKATKDELAQHVTLYQTLVETVTGINTRLTTAEGAITTNAGEISKNAAAIKTNSDNIAANLGEINGLKTRMTTAEGAIDAIEADYLKTADKEELAGEITKEVNRATKAEEDLDARIDDLEAKTEGISINVTASIEAAVNVEKQRAELAEQELAADIKAIADDYLTSEDKAALQAEIDADILVETNRAKAAEEALDGRLTTAEGEIDDLQLRVGNLGNALHFVGAGAFADRPVTGAAGDVYVVIDPEHENDGKEYVFVVRDDSSEWIEFGDVSDYATKADLQAEEAARKAADKTLTDDLAEEVKRASDAEAELAEDIGEEKSRAEQAEKVLTDDLKALTDRVDLIDGWLDEEGGSVTEAIAGMATTLRTEIGTAKQEAIDAAAEYTDAEIGKVEEAIAGLTSTGATKEELNDLAERVGLLDTAETGRVSVLEAEIDAVEGRATDLENELNTAETGLKARMTAAEAAIGENEAAIGVNATDIQTLYNALQWHQII